MLKGNLDKVVQHGKRADSIVKNMLLHSRAGLRRAPPDRHQRHRRGEPEPRLSRRARREAGLQHHAGEVTSIRRPARSTSSRRRSRASCSTSSPTASMRPPSARRRPTARPTSRSLAASTKRPRRQRRDQDPRQRHRHSAGGEGEDVQSVLHDQAGRRGDRPRPVAQPRHHREAACRHDRGRHASPASSPSSGSSCRAARPRSAKSGGDA